MAADDDPLRARDLLAAVSSSVVSALPVFLVSALAVQIGESLHFGPARLGFVVSSYFLSAAVASVPLSRVSEAVGSLRVMRAGCIVMGLILVVLATAVRSLPGLFAVMVAAGMVSAGLQPATNLFLTRRIPRRRQGVAFGIKQAAVPAAVLLGGLAVPTIGLTAGWQWAFAAAAALAIGASLLLPRSRTSFAAYRSRPATARLDTRARRHLALLACGFGLAVSAASALSAFTVTAAVAAGQAPSTAGLLASLGGALAGGTRIGVGARADRARRPHLVVVATMLCLGAVAYGMLAASTAGTPVLLIPGVALAFAAGWGWNGLFNFAVVSRYPLQAAQATGITAVGGRLGGMSGPLAFGLVVTHFSYTDAWLLAAAAALTGAAIIFTGHRLHGSEAPPA